MGKDGWVRGLGRFEGVGTWEGGGWGREMCAHVVDELLLQALHVGLEDLVLLY